VLDRWSIEHKVPINLRFLTFSVLVLWSFQLFTIFWRRRMQIWSIQNFSNRDLCSSMRSNRALFRLSCQTRQQAMAQPSHSSYVAHSTFSDVIPNGHRSSALQESTRRTQSASLSDSYRGDFAKYQTAVSLRLPAVGRVTLFRAATWPRDRAPRRCAGLGPPGIDRCRIASIGVASISRPTL